MLSTRWRRIVATLTGAWLFVILTTPTALWACQAHGGSHMAAAHMDMGHQQQQDHAHHHQCTCPGCCCGVAAVALGQGRLVALPVVPIAVVSQAPEPPVGAPRDRTIHHRLPLPQGPPALRA